MFPDEVPLSPTAFEEQPPLPIEPAPAPPPSEPVPPEPAALHPLPFLPEPEPALSEPAPLEHPPEEPALPDPPLPDELEDWDDEELPEDDEEFLDPADPDPFISGDLKPAPPLPAGALEQRRREARAEALSGEHRISLSDSVAPGSLAQALNELLQEGKVTAEFCEGDEDGPYLLYRPLS